LLLLCFCFFCCVLLCTNLTLFTLTILSFYCGTRVWTHGFAFARQVLYHSSYIFSPFFLWLFLR
jgi:hypothetical protein